MMLLNFKDLKVETFVTFSIIIPVVIITPVI